MMFQSFDCKLRLISSDEKSADQNLERLCQALHVSSRKEGPVRMVILKFGSGESESKRLQVRLETSSGTDYQKLLDDLCKKPSATLIATADDNVIKAAKEYRKRSEETHKPAQPIATMTPAKKGCLGDCEHFEAEQQQQIMEWINGINCRPSISRAAWGMGFTIVVLILLTIALILTGSTTQQPLGNAERLIFLLKEDREKGFVKASEYSRQAFAMRKDSLDAGLKERLGRALDDHHRTWIRHIIDVSRNRSFNNEETKGLLIGFNGIVHLGGETKPLSHDIEKAIVEKSGSRDHDPDTLKRHLDTLINHYNTINDISDESRNLRDRIGNELAHRYLVRMTRHQLDRSTESIVRRFATIQRLSNELRPLLAALPQAPVSDALGELTDFLALLPLQSEQGTTMVCIQPRQRVVTECIDKGLSALCGNEADVIINYYGQPTGGGQV